MGSKGIGHNRAAEHTHTLHHHARLLELKIDQRFRIQLMIIAIIHILLH